MKHHGIEPRKTNSKIYTEIDLFTNTVCGYISTYICIYVIYNYVHAYVPLFTNLFIAQQLVIATPRNL